MMILKTTPLDPQAREKFATDLFVQEAIIKTGEKVPEGWRIISGNNNSSLIARVIMFCELETGQNDI